MESIVKEYSNAGLMDVLEFLKEKATKASWCEKAVIVVFNAINGIVCGIAANQLTPLVIQDLALLA